MYASVDWSFRNTRRRWNSTPHTRKRSRVLPISWYRGSRQIEAETYYRRDLALYLDDPEALGSLAAIDFGQSWPDLVQTKSRLNIGLETPLFQLPSCPEVRDRIQTRVQEGLAFATKAQLLVTNNSDLIGFLSILYSFRAEIQCGNRPAYEADLNAALRWDQTRKQMWESNVQEETLRNFPPAPPPPE